MIDLSARDLLELLAGAFYLGRTLTQLRSKKWRKELLGRVQRENIEHQNATVKTLSEAFASGEQPTLEELVENAEKNFEIKATREMPPRFPPSRWGKLL